MPLGKPRKTLLAVGPVPGIALVDESVNWGKLRLSYDCARANFLCDVILDDRKVEWFVRLDQVFPRDIVAPTFGKRITLLFLLPISVCVVPLNDVRKRIILQFKNGMRVGYRLVDFSWAHMGFHRIRKTRWDVLNLFCSLMVFAWYLVVCSGGCQCLGKKVMVLTLFCILCAVLKTLFKHAKILWLQMGHSISNVLWFGFSLDLLLKFIVPSQTPSYWFLIIGWCRNLLISRMRSTLILSKLIEANQISSLLMHFCP